MKIKQLALIGLLITSCSTDNSGVAYHQASYEKIIFRIDQYKIECGDFPHTLTELINPKNCDNWEKIPTTAIYDIWSKPYQYKYPSIEHADQVEYELFSYGADGEEGTEDDIANWLPEEHWIMHYATKRE